MKLPRILITLLLCVLLACSTVLSQKTYRNAQGHRVKSPVHSKKTPVGATAQCRDGSYSFSQNHRGTCSHHGGVAVWLR